MLGSGDPSDGSGIDGLEIEAVRAALIEGEKSGKPKRFDANAFKRRLRRAHG